MFKVWEDRCDFIGTYDIWLFKWSICSFGDLTGDLFLSEQTGMVEDVASVRQEAANRGGRTLFSKEVSD